MPQLQGLQQDTVEPDYGYHHDDDGDGDDVDGDGEDGEDGDGDDGGADDDDDDGDLARNWLGTSASHLFPL